MAFISVIVPNYNHAQYLEQRIESILNQTFQDFELILLDDCSTDDSKKIIEQYREHPKVSAIIYNASNSGSTFIQWNLGVEVAKAEWINIAESDDFSDPEFLKTLATVIQSDQEIVLAYCQSNQVDKNSIIKGNWEEQTKKYPSPKFNTHFIMNGDAFINACLLKENVIPNASAVVFKKSAFIEIGKARIDIAKCGDWYVWIRLLLLGSVTFVPEALNNFRYHTESVIAKASNKNSIYTKFYYDGILRQQLKKDFIKLEDRQLYIDNNLMLNQLRYSEVTYLIQNRFFLIAFKKSISLLFTRPRFWLHIPYITKILFKTILFRR